MQAAPQRPTAHAVADPDAGIGVLRDRAWSVPAFTPYLERLQRETGEDFSLLTELTRSSLMYQSGIDHLRTRRAIAAFLSPAGVASWRPAIDAAVEAGLERLAASPAPDLVRDFSNPVFVGCLGAIMNLKVGDEARLLDDIAAMRRLVEPMLSLRRLREAQAGLARMLGQLAPTPITEGPRPLGAVLDAGALPADVSVPVLTVSLVAAAYTTAHNLALALAALLREGPETWRAVAEPGWAEGHLEDLIGAFPATLTLYRVAHGGAALGGCPAAAGDVAAIDIAAVNGSLERRRDVPGGRGPRSISFGEGAHKCPAAALARLILGRALPAIAARFPHLRLDEAGVRIDRSVMQWAPTALPCTGTGVRRRAARLWEIGDHDLARAIATDAERFGPSEMAGHLAAMAAASGRDFSVAIRIARNAPFFLSGQRQHAIRLLTLDVLGNNRLARWTPFVDRTVAGLLDDMGRAPRADLVTAFCDPLFRVVTRAVLGLYPKDAARFDAAAPRLQELQEPLLSLRTILQLQEVCAILLDEVAGEAPPDLPPDLPPSLLARLDAGEPEGFDRTDRRALVLTLYGASVNIAHTLANALHRLAGAPPEARRALVEAPDGAWLDGDVLPGAASARFIYRMAHADGAIGEFRFARGDMMQLHLREINRDRGAGHLALGHGLHRCLGAALVRLVMRRALPALLRRYPDFALAAEPAFLPASQMIAPAALPVVLSATPRPPEEPEFP